MMKKLLLLGLVLIISGCSSFGRGIAEAFLDNSKKEDTRACEIKGHTFNGVDYYFKKGETVKVLMIHGVGTHASGYSTRLQENLAKTLELDVLSKRPKEITLVNPKDGKTVIGMLWVTRMQNKEKTRDLLFYELTWSGITAREKEILAYDNSGIYSHKRADLNHTFKQFLNDTGPDPMIYLSDEQGLILSAVKQSSCWLLGYNWDTLPQDSQSVCKISGVSQLKTLNKEKIIYITHSLGSRILIDSFDEMVNEISGSKFKGSKDYKLIVEELKNKDFTVFMLANQLPILQIGRKAPRVVNQYKEYCTKKGKDYNSRVFKKVNIVAFSDPNDLLSYDIPQKFVDKYIDSRMCPVVTNVNINVASELSAFGVGLVNPMTAHTEYDNDNRVINIISDGAGYNKNNEVVNQRCQFIKLEP